MVFNPLIVTSENVRPPYKEVNVLLSVGDTIIIAFLCTVTTVKVIAGLLNSNTLLLNVIHEPTGNFKSKS